MLIPTVVCGMRRVHFAGSLVGWLVGWLVGCFCFVFLLVQSCCVCFLPYLLYSLANWFSLFMLQLCLCLVYVNSYA